MDGFYRQRAYTIRSAMRDGDREALLQEIEFCRNWGSPLELLALVAEQHLQLMEQGKLQRAAGSRAWAKDPAPPKAPPTGQHPLLAEMKARHQLKMPTA